MRDASREHGRRGVARAAVAAAAAALVAALLGGAQPAHGAPSPKFFGIAPSAPEDLGEAEYERMGRARVGTLRVPFFWPHIQPETQAGEPGGEPSYDWGYTDRIVTQATINGMTVLPFVYGTPSWTGSSVRLPPVRSERARRGWDALFRVLVGRYGPNGTFWTTPELAPEGHDPNPITDWQIWNEPNSPTFMKQGHDTAGAYARMLDIADRAIHETDPDAQVVSAGLFASPAGGEEFESFLHRLFQNRSVDEDIDVLGLHPYAPKIGKLVERFEFARRVMRQHGVNKPIWVTELGWPTGGTREGNFRKTLRGQAAILRRSFDLLIARRSKWGIAGIVWYTWRDNRLQPGCDICSYSGLFRRDGGPKPAWDAFVDYTGGQP